MVKVKSNSKSNSRNDGKSQSSVTKKVKSPELIEEEVDVVIEAEVEEEQKKDQVPNKDKELTEALQEIINRYGVYEVETKLDELRLSEDDLNEPLLNPKNQRFTYFPIQYSNVEKLYKEQRACNWEAEEIDFSKDYEDYMTLNKNEQHFIDMILAFFAASDGIVNFNLNERFTRDVKANEAQVAYQFQMSMENVHSEVYSLMLDNLIKDPVKKEYLFNASTTVPAVKLMSDWAFKWIKSSKSFAHRLVAFAIIEGVFFSGAFAAIFWLKKYRSTGKDFMNGLLKSNKLISRDEGLHCKFACELYSLLNKKLEEKDVYEIMEEGVAIAKNFSTESIQVKLIGMNNKFMCDYLEYIGDRLLNMLGYKKLYNKKNPFKFMETIGLIGKANFFEERPTEYQNPHTLNKSKRKDIVIEDTDECIDALDF